MTTSEHVFVICQIVINVVVWVRLRLIERDVEGSKR